MRAVAAGTSTHVAATISICTFGGGGGGFGGSGGAGFAHAPASTATKPHRSTARFYMRGTE